MENQEQPKEVNLVQTIQKELKNTAPENDPDHAAAIKQQVRASAIRGLAFDDRKRLTYGINKGLRKPGRISFETLRRVSTALHVARICITVLKEKITKTDWDIQFIDHDNGDPNDPRLKEVKDFFKHPNKNNETFRTLLDKMLEDLLVLDSVCLEKTRYPDGKLAELHFVDATTIRPVFDEHGIQDVLIELINAANERVKLPVSYVQVMNNSQYGGPESGDIVAAWPKKDMLYFSMHPQGSWENFGYGMSPLESVMPVVANLLNADNYNGTYFEEGAFPPTIIQLMTGMNERDLEATREYLYAELTGNFHRPAIFAGQEEAKVINLKGNNNRDMEFMEYMKFMSRLMAAAYGLSAQDIGLTEEIGSKNVSETQKELSQAKGYGSILDLLKEVFNQEIIWKDFGYEDLEFEWVGDDSIDVKEASDIYDKALRNGTMTLNEVRNKLGLKPYDDFANEPLLLGASGYGPLMAPPPAPAPTFDENGKPIPPKEGELPKPGEQNKPQEGQSKKPEIVGGEKPYNEQSKPFGKKIRELFRI